MISGHSLFYNTDLHGVGGGVLFEGNDLACLFKLLAILLNWEQNWNNSIPIDSAASGS